MKETVIHSRISSTSVSTFPGGEEGDVRQFFESMECAHPKEDGE
jgi:hypothetical protein